MNDEVYCLFVNYSDGYTCSSRDLVGVFQTMSDAEEGLLKFFYSTDDDQIHLNDLEIEVFRIGELK